MSKTSELLKEYGLLKVEHDTAEVWDTEILRNTQSEMELIYHKLEKL